MRKLKAAVWAICLLLAVTCVAQETTAAIRAEIQRYKAVVAKADDAGTWKEVKPLVSETLNNSEAALNRVHRAEAAGQLRQTRARQPVGSVQRVLQHAAVSERDHVTSTVSPSYAGSTPAGRRAARSAWPVSWVRCVR